MHLNPAAEVHIGIPHNKWIRVPPGEALNHAINVVITGSDDGVKHVVSNVAAQLIWNKADLFEVGLSICQGPRVHNL